MQSGDDTTEDARQEPAKRPPMEDFTPVGDINLTASEPTQETTLKFEDPLIGTLFADRYRVLTEVGHGGMSIVYLAKHEGLNQLMALKILHRHLVARQTTVLRFGQEAHAVSLLDHPNIIRVHDFGITPDGTPFLVMDYVNGNSLERLIKQGGALPPNEVIDIFVQVTDALSHAHSKRIIHRDLKPSNIMLAEIEGQRVAKIVDFGVAKILEDSEEQKAKLTQTGEAVGSPLYMSPEQCLGQNLDARSDVYSIGCVMYEALTGRAAFASDSVFGTLFKQTSEMPPGLLAANPNLEKNDQLELIIFKALAKEPNTRYQSMSDLKSDLEKLRKRSSRSFLSATRNLWELQKLKRAPLGPFKVALPIWAYPLALGAMICIAAFAIGLTYLQQLQPWQSPKAIPLWAPYEDTEPGKVADLSRLNGADLRNENTESQDRLQSTLRRWAYHQAEIAGDWHQLINWSVNLADLYRKEHMYTDAIDYYGRAFEIERRMESEGYRPKVDEKVWMTPASYHMGNCLYAMRDYRAAQSRYQLTINLMKENLENSGLDYGIANLRLADCFYYQNDPEHALQVLRSIRDAEKLAARKKDSSSDALNIVPQNDRSLFVSKLADTEEMMNNWTDAVEDYTHALGYLNASDEESLKHRFVAKTQLAVALIHRDKRESSDEMYKSAIQDLREISEHRDDSISYALRQRAALLWQRNDFIESIKLANLAKRFQ